MPCIINLIYFSGSHSYEVFFPPVSEKRETLVRLSSSIGNQRGVRGNAKVGIQIYGKVVALFKAKGEGLN